MRQFFLFAKSIPIIPRQNVKGGPNRYLINQVSDLLNGITEIIDLV